MWLKTRTARRKDDDLWPIPWSWATDSHHPITAFLQNIPSPIAVESRLDSEQVDFFLRWQVWAFRVTIWSNWKESNSKFIDRKHEFVSGGRFLRRWLPRASGGGQSRPIRRWQSRQSLGNIHRRQELTHRQLQEVPHQIAAFEGLQTYPGCGLWHRVYKTPTELSIPEFFIHYLLFSVFAQSGFCYVVGGGFRGDLRGRIR